MSFSATNALLAQGTTVETIFSDNFSDSLLPKDHNSVQNIAANLEICDVIEKLGDCLFPKEYESKWGLKLLIRLGNAEFTDEEFEGSNLKDQMQIVSSICHSRLLNASDRGAELNSAEITAIKNAFANLGAVYSKKENPSEAEQKIISDIKVLNESLPCFLQISKAFVGHIKSFQSWIPKLIEKYEVSEEYSKTILYLGDQLFTGTPSCSRNPSPPNLKNVMFDRCFPEVINFISSVAKRASDAKRELSDDELTSISKVLESLSNKMNNFRKANLINLAKGQLAAKQKYLSSRLTHLNKAIAEKEEELKELKDNLEDYRTSTEPSTQFKDVNSAIERGIKNREQKIDKVGENLAILKEDKAKREKSLLNTEGQMVKFETKTIEFANDNFYSKAYMELDIPVQEYTIQSLMTLSKNPEVVANFSLEYISFLEDESNRKPKSWFSTILGL